MTYRSQPTRLSTACKYLASISLAISVVCITGCTTTAQTPNVANFGYVQQQSIQNAPDGSISSIRLKALQDTATSLGAQGALALRSQQINHMLKNKAQHLDAIFNFNILLIHHNVLPPVLVESQNNYQQNSDTLIRYNQKSYKIFTEARFVTAAPSWRDYLVMRFAAPNQPDHTLLPKNSAEVKVWNEALTQGWKQGLDQANEIFKENIARLRRDYTGIVLYKRLLDHHMVSAPYIAKAQLGVTGDSNKININDQVMRITKGSQLNTDPNKWRALITD